MYIKNFNEFHSINEGLILKKLSKSLIDAFKIASLNIKKLWFDDIEEPYDYIKSVLYVLYVTKHNLKNAQKYLYENEYNMKDTEVIKLKKYISDIKIQYPNGINVNEAKDFFIKEVEKTKKITKEKEILIDKIKNLEDPVEIQIRYLNRYTELILKQLVNNKFVLN